MRKLIIIFIGAFTLLFGINVKASTFYTLETPIAELNNHTLREVFENRNMAMPDLTGVTDLGNGIYQISSTYGVTLTYNIYNGYLVFNGSFNEATTISFVSTGTNELDTYTIKLTEISGTKTINNNNILLSFDSGTIAVLTNVISGYTDTFNYNYVRFYCGLAGAFDNYTVKLQLEKGNTATPYQVATNGPYSQIDISTLDLTVEQMDYWFNVYQEVLNDIERVNNLPSLFNDIFGELTNNFVIGFRGFTELIYLDGYGLTDLGIILLIVSSISIIGFAFYIVRKVVK